METKLLTFAGRTQDDKRPFVYMRHFRTMYSQWCIKHGYEPVQSRDEIIRLVSISLGEAEKQIR